MGYIKVSLKVLKSIAFAALLVTSFLFVSTQVKSFWDGKTLLIESKRPLSVDDMPTLTICFKDLTQLKYGQDINIMAHIPHTASLTTLKMGLTMIEDTHVHLKKLYLDPTRSRDCFVLNFKFKEEHLAAIVKEYELWDMFFMLGLFKISLRTGNETTHPFSHQPTIHISSYKNSYGSAISHWYDGVVDPIDLKFGHFHYLQITQTIEYRYLKGTCSGMSFAECKASKLMDCNSCQENGQYCAPYSLPKGNNFEDMEVCQGNITYVACNREFSEKTWLKCKAQKACLMTEYSVDEFKMSQSMLKDKNTVEKDLKRFGVDDEHMKMLLDEPTRSFMFDVAFDHPDSSRGDEKLHVRILEERLLWTGIDLVGMIGGQMGLFLGFSFIHSIARLLDIIGGYCAKFSNL